MSQCLLTSLWNAGVLSTYHVNILLQMSLPGDLFVSSLYLYIGPYLIALLHFIFKHCLVTAGNKIKNQTVFVYFYV